jgi:hypothetical protein
MLRRSLRILIAVPLLFAAYAAVLCVPQPVFAFSVRTGNLELRSDRPFTDASGARVLLLARSKLEHSPLYSASQTDRVFVCNARWRQVLFFNKDYGAGGVAPYPVTANVFLRDANIEENRLISPGGKPVAGDRTLDYFIAHEITHQLTGRALGPVRYLRLPQWVREGYADYVGKGGSFNYGDARRAFLANAPEMDWKRSGLYSRFHLLVAYLLDHQSWTVEQLLRNPPPQAEVEAAVAREP